MLVLLFVAAIVSVVYGGDNCTCGCMQGPPGRDGRDGVPGPPGPSSPIVVELQELKKTLIDEMKAIVRVFPHVQTAQHQSTDKSYLTSNSPGQRGAEGRAT